MEARNSIGYSNASTSIAVLAAIVPSQPAAPSTSASINSVIISWTAPVSNNGSPIKAYKIYILQ